MRKTILKDFYQPTPIFYRKIGDSIMYFCGLMNAPVVGLPIPDDKKVWIIFTLSTVGIIGKTITNFFTEKPEETKQDS